MFQRNLIVRLVLLALTLLLLSTPVLATGRLRGSVQDNTGAPLADVELELVATDSGIPATKIQSNKKGKFVFGLIRPGTYTLFARRAGLRVSRIDANVAVPEDESLWAFHENLVPGAELPKFSVTGVTTVTYDVTMTANEGEVGRYGTGVPVSPTVGIVKAIEAQEFDSALALADKSLQLNAQAPSLHYLRSFALDALGRLDDALAAVDRALELDAKFEGANLLRGKILEERGETDRALAAYRTEAESAQSVEVRRDALIASAAACSASGRADEAITALEKLIALVPDHVGAYKELADLYLRRGDKERAQAMMTKVSALGASDPNLLYNLGAERFNANDFQAAADFFAQAVAADPSFREAHLRLGYTRLSLGEMDAAAQSLQKFLDLSSEETDEVQSARAILQQLQKK